MGGSLAATLGLTFDKPLIRSNYPAALGAAHLFYSRSVEPDG
jgi:hypothetical protein